MPKLSKAALDDRRLRILLAAAACFDRQGFHRTTIADIKREAGVSTGAIYTYFSTKEAMVRALLEGAQAERRAQLTAAASPQAAEALLLSWARRAFSTEGRQIARVDINLWAEALRDRAVGQLARTAVRDATAAVAATLDKQGAPNARAHAEVLVSLLIGLEVQLGIGVKLEEKSTIEALSVLFAPHLSRMVASKQRAGAARRRRKSR